MKDELKIYCQTPTPGKTGTRIPAWKYHAVRNAILEVLDAEKEIYFKGLSEAVSKRLSSDTLSRLGSVNWHVTTVKLNMEFEGEIMRIEGVKPQKLERTPL